MLQLVVEMAHKGAMANTEAEPKALSKMVGCANSWGARLCV